MEMEYELQTFGIPPNTLSHQQQMDPKSILEQAWQDEQASKKSVTLLDGVCCEYPNPQDILCGRGWPYREHSGNQRFVERMNPHRVRYQQAKRIEKLILATDIAHTILEDKQTNCRFLKRSSHGWIELSEQEAIERVTRALRSKEPTTPTPDGDNVSNVSASKKPRHE